MKITYTGYIGKVIILFFYLFFSDKKMMLPNTFVLWVWIIFIVNVFLNHFCRGQLSAARKITRIYLHNKPEVSAKKERKMSLELIPGSMAAILVIWSILMILSFAWILIYQGLILGISAEILLFILIAILPVQYNSHLRYFYKYFEGSESKKSKAIIEAGFDLEDVKSIIDKTIKENINPHKWWREVEDGKR
ncbi:MAG: hypothetical protein K9M99_07945 [Candidatus Cloacimonetes bacterium]|nr:hypothetical protein [Candidatus Cloacimonadota bacterium]